MIMAKRRKEKSEEDEVDFKLPKFDEKKFLLRERRNIKVTFISFLFGFIIAILSFGFWSLLSESPFRWELVLLFCIFTGSWLRYIFTKLNICHISFQTELLEHFLMSYIFAFGHTASGLFYAFFGLLCQL